MRWVHVIASSIGQFHKHQIYDVGVLLLPLFHDRPVASKLAKKFTRKKAKNVVIKQTDVEKNDLQFS